jgi:hypothetical protein
MGASKRLSNPPNWMPTSHLPPLAPEFYEHDYLAPLCGRQAVQSTFGARPSRALRRIYD